MLHLTNYMQPHQLAAVERLRDALVDLDSYDEVPADDAFVCLDEDNVFTQLNDEAGAMFTLGHLRDILAIFTEQSA